MYHVRWTTFEACKEQKRQATKNLNKQATSNKLQEDEMKHM